jgi:hypothetical protein
LLLSALPDFEDIISRNAYAIAATIKYQS